MIDKNDDFAALRDLLIRHEALRLRPYFCSAGKATIGVGRNLDDVGITRSEAEQLLANDMRRVSFELERAVPRWRSFSQPRRLALMDMLFNLGLPRFLQFKKLLAALGDNDFARAADEMLNSRWAAQVGQRAQTLATMMREG